jgi:glucose-6-phosphate isomerase
VKQLGYGIVVGLLLTGIILFSFNAVRDFPVTYATKVEIAKEAEARASADCKLDAEKLNTERFVEWMKQDNEYKKIIQDMQKARDDAQSKMITELQKGINELAKKK